MMMCQNKDQFLDHNTFDFEVNINLTFDTFDCPKWFIRLYKGIILQKKIANIP